jgi:hypothetical protein
LLFFSKTIVRHEKESAFMASYLIVVVDGCDEIPTSSLTVMCALTIRGTPSDSAGTAFSVS